VVLSTLRTHRRSTSERRSFASLLKPLAEVSLTAGQMSDRRNGHERTIGPVVSLLIAYDGIVLAHRTVEPGGWSTKTAVFEAGNRITPQDRQALCSALSG
jgi:hypothetical protein